jgi:hypothetical protein
MTAKHLSGVIYFLSAVLVLGACSGGGDDNDIDPADPGGSSSSSSSGSSSGSTTPPTPPPDTTIPAGGLGGTVDSSLIDRGSLDQLLNLSAGINKVYLYAGNITPDDIGSGGVEPIQTADVLQDSGYCTWRYLFNSVPAGDYTIAFTSEADLDNAGGNDNIAFTGTDQIAVSDTLSNEKHFTVNNIIRVGPGKAYTTISDAIDDADDGDIIEIDAGVYADDFTGIDQDNLTLRGVNGRAHLRADNMIPDNGNGKGIWITGGNNIRVENIEFSGATVTDENGAGIRAEGNNLSICNSYFHDNENGILGEDGGTMLIEYSEFAANGFGDGYTHNLYIDGGNTLVFRFNYSHHARIGHNLKSRAAENYVLYNRIMDEDTGTSSYIVDIPDGGLTYLIGNLLQQGSENDNSTMVAYAAESDDNGVLELYAVNNTFVNDYGSGQFIDIASGTDVLVMNNIFAGDDNAPSGTGVSNNHVVSDPDVVDRAGFDYQLNGTSNAINSGAVPGSANGFSLTPVYEYVHPIQYRIRPADAILDAGAYEYD